jgi:hypothetical protein
MGKADQRPTSRTPKDSARDDMAGARARHDPAKSEVGGVTAGSRGYGVAPTPWGAVQMAAGTAVVGIPTPPTRAEA